MEEWSTEFVWLRAWLYDIYFWSDIRSSVVERGEGLDSVAACYLFLPPSCLPVTNDNVLFKPLIINLWCELTVCRAQLLK